MLSKRGTSFGYGTRTTFNVKKGAPPPGKYNISSGFGNLKNRGKSFGLSRELTTEKSGDKGYSTRYPIPGPGTYNATYEIGKDSLKYSLRPKIFYKSKRV